MTEEAFSSTKGPWIHLANATPTSAIEWAWAFSRRCDHFAVRFLRGKKMRKEQQLFDEIGAALQFPHYFGENWDAMDECITDLSWLPAKGYLLVVIDSQQVLADENDRAWATFLRLVNDAGREWAKPSGQGEPYAREATPFHVVLQARGDDVTRISDRLAASGVECSSVTIP